MSTSATTGESTAKTASAADLGRRAKWWRRIGSKSRGFRYADTAGNLIADEASLERIKKLVIPPAWKDVRICPRAGGRLQAVGLDKNGRLQYLYHSDFAARRQQDKYRKIERFGERLPLIRRATNEHLELEGLPKEKVLAAMIRLINDLNFRLGTESSVRQYKTYGITTLRNRHVTVNRGGALQFDFVGKHHIRHSRVAVDSDLASVLAELKTIGGARLFNCRDVDGRVIPILPRDVNAYIKEYLGPEFSAKDFRTWAGTVEAAAALTEIGPAESDRQLKRNVAAAVKRVAAKLGNTPTVCRSCYIHPVVYDRYRAGITLEHFRPRAERIIRGRMPDYESEELSLIALFRTRSVPEQEEAEHLLKEACQAIEQQFESAAA